MSEPTRGPEPAARRLADDSAELVRAELARVRDDAARIARRSLGGVLLGTVAAAGGLMALRAVETAVQRAADRVLPPRAAAAVLAGTYLAGAVVAGTAAVWRLRAVSRAAGRAAADLRADVDAAVPRSP